MNIVDPMIRRNPDMKVAVIDKDEPGGICLTRGCIPSKILLYPAELIRTVERTGRFGIEIDLKSISFRHIMERMRDLINSDIEGIRRGLTESKNIDYYHDLAKFVEPYTLEVAGERIRSDMILLCTGSKPVIPDIDGIEDIDYLTSRSLLELEELPQSVAIIGGGYIAAEYGHFLSAMGAEVTIIGRNPQFLPEEEPEISQLAKSKMKEHMNMITNHEIREIEETTDGKKSLMAYNMDTGERTEIRAEEVLVATGREPTTDVLDPERGGIEIDQNGWIVTDEYLQTSQSNVWALGDANGKHLFKHVANYESVLIYQNAVLGRSVEVKYHAVPHAVFTYPEITSVGLRENEVVDRYGEDDVLVGVYRYQDTAKGEAMDVEDYFVKVLVPRDEMRILGAHIVGPYASILIQEVVNLMYTPDRSMWPMVEGMHIHPALSEVVERAFNSLMPPQQYHHLMEHHYGLSLEGAYGPVSESHHH
jgi:dihydrolipoamide dehydrogenase